MTYHDEDDDLNTKSIETGELSVSRASSTGSSSFARSETRRVTRSKYIVAAVIMVAAVIVGSLTFTFARNGEEEDFEKQVSFRPIVLMQCPVVRVSQSQHFHGCLVRGIYSGNCRCYQQGSERRACCLK